MAPGQMPKNLAVPRLQVMDPLQRLERIQNLAKLKRSQKLQKINFTSKSYELLEIQDNSIVYCDPPYKGTNDYGNKFNTEDFLDWADSQKEPVFISEYKMQEKILRK